MPKLYRPHIPLAVRAKVAERQLRGLIHLPPSAIIAPDTSLKIRLESLLIGIARMLDCDVSELRLDHDPALGARPRTGEGKQTIYDPPANDPAHLFYRPHGAEYVGSHLIKTNVRGDNGQHPDRVLIKKQRRLERGPKPRRGPPIRSAGFASKGGAKLRGGKVKWAKRPFPKRPR
jgi:hypothetical protein